MEVSGLRLGNARLLCMHAVFYRLFSRITRGLYTLSQNFVTPSNRRVSHTTAGYGTTSNPSPLLFPSRSFLLAAYPTHRRVSSFNLAPTSTLAPEFTRVPCGSYYSIL